MNIFIDSNIFLTFYQTSSEALEELAMSLKLERAHSGALIKSLENFGKTEHLLSVKASIAFISIIF